MRRLIYWIILLPLAAAVVTFALNNRHAVMVDLWPFGLEIELPVYLAVLGMLAVGVFLGGVATWWAGGRLRGRYREKAYEAEVLRRELAEEHQKLKRLQDANPPPYPPAGISGRSDPAELAPPR